MTVSLRRSGTDEAELHLSIQRAASLAALAHVYPPDEFPFPDDAVRERWRTFPGTVLLAERAGEAVGIVGYEGCWLHGLYVVPHQWGTGVSGVLHDAALEALADCPELHLWVLEDNRRARRFYEQRGWRADGETRVVEYPPHPTDVRYTLVREEP